MSRHFTTTFVLKNETWLNMSRSARWIATTTLVVNNRQIPWCSYTHTLASVFPKPIYGKITHIAYILYNVYLFQILTLFVKGFSSAFSTVSWCVITKHGEMIQLYWSKLCYSLMHQDSHNQVQLWLNIPLWLVFFNELPYFYPSARRVL